MFAIAQLLAEHHVFTISINWFCFPVLQSPDCTACVSPVSKQYSCTVFSPHPYLQEVNYDALGRLGTASDDIITRAADLIQGTLYVPAEQGGLLHRLEDNNGVLLPAHG